MKYATWRQQSVIGTLREQGYLAPSEVKKSQDEDNPYGEMTTGEASEAITLGKLRKENYISCFDGLWEVWDKKQNKRVPVTPEMFELYKLPEIYAESETEVVR